MKSSTIGKKNPRQDETAPSIPKKMKFERIPAVAAGTTIMFLTL